MPARVQSLVYGLGLNKQTSISSPGSTFLRFRKLNMDIHTPEYTTETDKDEIGKGNEFISEVFPVAYTASGRVEKYGSAEYMTWAWAYALGNVTFGSGIYTIVPIDPTVTLELPYFSIVQQLGEGGGMAVDEVYVGNAVEDVTTTYNYGTGRQSCKTTVNWAGSGRNTEPSGITVPSVLAEHYMLSASMAANINGTDYVAGKTLLNGTMAWKNNLAVGAGYFPGSGLVNNAAVAGRLEIGNRVPTFTFTARLLHTSTEYAALIAQTTGTATITFTYDGTHTVTFTWEQLSYQAVTKGEEGGIVTVQVTGAPQFNSVNGVVSVSAQCGLTGVAQ